MQDLERLRAAQKEIREIQPTLQSMEGAQRCLEKAEKQLSAALGQVYQEPEKARQGLLTSLEACGEEAARQMRAVPERYGELRTEKVWFFWRSDERARLRAYNAGQWGREYYRARQGAPASEALEGARARLAQAEGVVRQVGMSTYQLEKEIGGQVVMLNGRERHHLARALTPGQIKMAERAAGAFLKAIDPERDRGRGLGR